MFKVLVDSTVQQQTGSGTASLSIPRGALDVSIVVPTFKERDNVAELVRRLDTALQGMNWEIVFVDDDSPDDTAEAVRALAGADPRVRCLQRIGRRGLSSACVEGMLSCAAPALVVMDADLQHDERILPQMIDALRAEEVDIVVGSRYTEGGGVGNWNERRKSISKLATRISHLVVPKELQDPMSGFFAIKRTAFMGCVRDLSAMGFKILVDLFASSPKPLRFREVPYTFRTRHAGESKLDNQVAWDYGMLLLDKLIGHIVPVRFIAFAAIGGVGVVVHLAILTALFKSATTDFVVGQSVATSVAMVFNFTINNIITYRDQQLRGLRWLQGLLSFVVACSVGALANVGIANYMFQRDQGWLLAALAGILVGAVWNYAVTAVYTWGKPKAK